MASSELEVAKTHLALAERVRDDKQRELKSLEEWVAKQRVGLDTAHEDVRLAIACLVGVEQRLQVVVIDDDKVEGSDGDDHQSTHDEGNQVETLDVTAGRRDNDCNDEDLRLRRALNTRHRSHPHRHCEGGSRLFQNPLWFGRSLSSSEQAPRLPASLRRSLKRYARKRCRLVSSDSDSSSREPPSI